jgi:hypothetical protein
MDIARIFRIPRTGVLREIKCAARCPVDRDQGARIDACDHATGKLSEPGQP